MSLIKLIDKASLGDALTWSKVVQALESGHRQPRALVSDQFLERRADTLLSRAAWVDGLGIGVKSVSVLPDNPDRGLPSIHGAMLIFEDGSGQVEAVIDSELITNWKTAADSVLGARLLARPESRSLLIVGAGTLAENLVRAYSELFPELERIRIWNRTKSRAEALTSKLREQGYILETVTDLPKACGLADIICTATMSSSPVLFGDWVKAGTHVDLIGAYKPDMREADDLLLKKARLFVDSYDTTLEHIGELKIPLDQGVLSREDILADLYDLIAGFKGREQHADITVFKNGGGAHLDLMTAKCIMAEL